MILQKLMTLHPNSISRYESYYMYHYIPKITLAAAQKIIIRLIDWIEFYAVLAIFQPCKGEEN